VESAIILSNRVKVDAYALRGTENDLAMSRQACADAISLKTTPFPPNPSRHEKGEAEASPFGVLKVNSGGFEKLLQVKWSEMDC
jgi:hypothetical protein